MNSSIPLRAMAALFFFTLMLLQVPAVRSADSATMPAPTDRLIVQMREPGAGAQLASTLAAVAGVELSYIRAFDEDTHIFGLAQALPHAEVEALAERLRDDPEVLLATPDTLLFPAFEASDPLYQEYGWPLWAPALGSYGIDLSRAWDLTQGDPNLVIAILDTGALLNHEDLIGRHLATNPGYDMLSDLARAGDGNGRDPDPSDPGDFVTSNEAASGQPLAGCTVSDSSWHGAHVAGIIGATANNARGIAGVNQSSPLLYLRVLGKCGGYISDIADGVRWAVGLNVSGLPRNPNPARVINMSLGGSGTCNSFLQQAINDANNQGAVVIAAAGNSNQAADTYQPANCGGTITVAAVGRTGWRARYSNYGPLVDLAAPGGDRSVDTQIFSTVNSGRTVPVNDSYSAYQGTSMATPHVAGVVSLMLAVNPALTAAEVLSILQATATPFPAESSCIGLCGAGILNGGAAVDAATRRAYSSIALAQLHPLSLHFGGQLLGTASATQLLTLSNRGGQPLTASALQFSGAFRRQGGTCPNQFPFTLASEMSCTFGVIFNPDTIGQQVGQVLLTSNSVASPHSVPLSGEGLVAAATFSPAALSFAQQQVGTQSASQRITLASTGSAPLTIQGITISGDFVRSGGNCPTTFPAALAAGQSCTLDVRFVPTTATRTRGLVSLSSNALAAAAPVGLFGTGSAPALGFNPLALTFAPQIVGTTSPTQSITLSNPGSAPLSLEALSLTGDYERVGGSCATSFPATLAALASCSVEVRFVPTRRGTQEGQLSLFSNVPGGPYGVALHGNGLAPALSLTPQQIHFGGQTVGSPSLTQTLILSSTGDVPLQIAALTLDNEAFVRSGGDCPTVFPAMLASGSQCTLALRFTPTITDSYHATLSLTTNAPTSPNLVPVSGVGTTTPTMSLRLTPAELHFDEPSDRAFPMSQTVTISNGGEVPIRLEAFNLTNADFSLASAACGPLPYLLAPAATCSISVSLAATTAGSYQSVLDVVSDEPGATRQITLSGTLRAVRPGNLSLNTPNLTTNPYSVTLSFNVTRSNGSEGAMAAHYTITAERQPGDGDLLVNHVPLSFAADQTQQTIQVTLNRLSLIAVRDLVVTLDTPSAGTLRVPLPIEEHLVFLPLVQR